MFRLATNFEQHFGASFDFAVRAPGRVNLIGEHVDYSGYGVLPMAIDQDCVILVRLPKMDVEKNSKRQKTSKALHLMSTNTKLHEKVIEHPSTKIEIDKSKHEWTNYFLAGYKVSLFDNKSLLADGSVTFRACWNISV